MGRRGLDDRGGIRLDNLHRRALIFFAFMVLAFIIAAGYLSHQSSENTIGSSLYTVFVAPWAKVFSWDDTLSGSPEQVAQQRAVMASIRFALFVGCIMSIMLLILVSLVQKVENKREVAKILAYLNARPDLSSSLRRSR